ncbi:MAG: gluconokinase [Anaerolineae bacterium]|nr:gluconokinase [Anaerolineae bacterium]
MPLLILDIGSSSVRALLFEDDAQVINGSSIQRSHQFNVSEPGEATASAEQLRSLLEQCIDEVLTHPRTNEIRAVAAACFVGNMLGVAADYQPLTPLYTYADSRSAASVQELATKTDHASTLQRTGCRVHTAYHAPKLHWLKTTQPDLFNQVNQWTDFVTYCMTHWFGRGVPCSYSVASWSGLLNREMLNWDEIWLSTLGLSREQFPTLADVSDEQVGLSDAYAERWPILREVPFLLPLGDGAAANIGSGATSADTLALTIGTTAALRRIVTGKPPTVPDGLWAYRVTRDRHLVGGATTEGGNLYQWARSTLNLPDDDAIESALLAAEPGEHGLTLLPLLAGERSPGWWSQASGIVTGLRLGTSPVDILQALMEAVAVQLATIAEQLGEAQRVYAGGGALHRSAAWSQMLADALNVPLHLLATPEVTARGVAMLALHVLDGHDLDEFPVPVKTVYQPRTDYREQWRTIRKAQQQLYNQMRGGYSG